MVAGPPCFTKMKSSAEGVSLLFPPAIRHRRRIDLLCDGFREVELAGNHVAVADKNLEVNMGRAACGCWDSGKASLWHATPLPGRVSGVRRE